MKTSLPLSEYETATSYRRLVARLIDLAVAFFLLQLIDGIIIVLFNALFDLDSDTSMWFFIICFMGSLILYDTLMVRFWGKTLGKMALGLRVVNIDGEKPRWIMCLLRAVILYLCGIGIIVLTALTASLLGWIFIFGLSKYKRFPQDSITRTFVLQESKGQPVKAETFGHAPGPLSDLDRLYDQGIITKEEWERKKSETSK